VLIDQEFKQSVALDLGDIPSSITTGAESVFPTLSDEIYVMNLYANCEN
jgi:hypothetical protein